MCSERKKEKNVNVCEDYGRKIIINNYIREWLQSIGKGRKKSEFFSYSHFREKFIILRKKAESSFFFI